MPLFNTFGAATGRGYGIGLSGGIAGNSGILTSGTSYTLPLTVGSTINVLVIGGGGGGGGGNYRRTNSGYTVGAGGGGAGGNAYALNISVIPGQVITYSIGGAGSAGSAGYGIFTPLSTSGSAGGSTSVTVGGTVRAQASAGNGGTKSDNNTFSAGGSAGGVTTGTQLLTPTAGGDASDPSGSAGGTGAKGYSIATNIGLALANILAYGSSGATFAHGSGNNSQSGTIYGAGGGGGGTNQSDQESPANAVAAPGTAGAVFIWWGY